MEIAGFKQRIWLEQGVHKQLRRYHSKTPLLFKTLADGKNNEVLQAKTIEARRKKKRGLVLLW